MAHGMNLSIAPKNYTPGLVLSNIIWQGIGKDMEGVIKLLILVFYTTEEK